MRKHFERLTFKERNGHFGVCGMNETNEEQKITDAVYRLMKYEDTGLSPEQIRTLQKNQKFKYISFDTLTKQDLSQEVLVISKKHDEIIGLFPIKVILSNDFMKDSNHYEFVMYKQSPCSSKLKNKALKGGAKK